MPSNMADLELEEVRCYDELEQQRFTTLWATTGVLAAVFVLLTSLFLWKRFSPQLAPAPSLGGQDILPGEELNRRRFRAFRSRNNNGHNHP